MDESKAVRNQVDVVRVDAHATRHRDPMVKVWAPAIALYPEHEGFLREVIRMEGGHGRTAVLYVLIDGRHLRVEVKDLDGPTVEPEPSPFRKPTWKGVFLGPDEAPPVEVDPKGLALACQDPAKAVL